jgi:hypothetical protein
MGVEEADRLLFMEPTEATWPPTRTGPAASRMLVISVSMEECLPRRTRYQRVKAAVQYAKDEP